jgi:hypothetical protein
MNAPETALPGKHTSRPVLAPLWPLQHAFELAMLHGKPVTRQQVSCGVGQDIGPQTSEYFQG